MFYNTCESACSTCGHEHARNDRVNVYGQCILCVEREREILELKILATGVGVEYIDTPVDSAR